MTRVIQEAEPRINIKPSKPHLVDPYGSFQTPPEIAFDAAQLKAASSLYQKGLQRVAKLVDFLSKAKHPFEVQSILERVPDLPHDYQR